MSCPVLVPGIIIIGSYRRGLPVAIVRTDESVRSQVREPIELGVADLLNLDTEAIFKPLRRQVPMAKCFAGPAIGCRFPTQHYRRVAEADQPIEGFGRVESIEQLAVQFEVARCRHRTKPRAGLKHTQAFEAGPAARDAAANANGHGPEREFRKPGCGHDLHQHNSKSLKYSTTK
jgi:hypothetical protein